MERITDYETYKYFLERDRIALHIDYKKPRLFQDYVWRFEIELRKTEYAVNCLKGVLLKPYVLYRKFRFHRISRQLGFSIPINVFESGLSIGHYGTIVVNGKAHVGKNCRILEGVNIGGSSKKSGGGRAKDRKQCFYRNWRKDIWEYIHC